MTEKTSKKPLSFLDALAILFIGLKLTGYIDWPWWWVTASIWIPFILAVLVIAEERLTK